MEKESGEKDDFNVTISIGASYLDRTALQQIRESRASSSGAAAQELAKARERADRAAYHAKRSGRNRAIAYNDIPSISTVSLVPTPMPYPARFSRFYREFSMPKGVSRYENFIEFLVWASAKYDIGYRIVDKTSTEKVAEFNKDEGTVDIDQALGLRAPYAQGQGDQAGKDARDFQTIVDNIFKHEVSHSEDKHEWVAQHESAEDLVRNGSGAKDFRVNSLRFGLIPDSEYVAEIRHVEAEFAQAGDLTPAPGPHGVVGNYQGEELQYIQDLITGGFYGSDYACDHMAEALGEFEGMPVEYRYLDGARKIAPGVLAKVEDNDKDGHKLVIYFSSRDLAHDFSMHFSARLKTALIYLVGHEYVEEYLYKGKNRAHDAAEYYVGRFAEIHPEFAPVLREAAQYFWRKAHEYIGAHRPRIISAKLTMPVTPTPAPVTAEPVTPDVIVRNPVSLVQRLLAKIK